MTDLPEEVWVGRGTTDKNGVWSVRSGVTRNGDVRVKYIRADRAAPQPPVSDQEKAAIIDHIRELKRCADMARQDNRKGAEHRVAAYDLVLDYLDHEHAALQSKPVPDALTAPVVPDDVTISKADLDAAMEILSTSDWFGQFNSITTPDWFVRLAYAVSSDSPTAKPIEAKPEAMTDALTFDQIEACFPEGATTDDQGHTVVSAQWLHDFARQVISAAQSNTVPQGDDHE